MKNKSGYRGYIGTRAYYSGKFPQRMQNMLIRNYCQVRQLAFLLSGTEYAMPGCYMILEEIVDALPVLEGVVLFSIFMLPQSAKKRRVIYQKIMDQRCGLHAALEDLSIKSWDDVQAVEDILNLKNIITTDQSIHAMVKLLQANKTTKEICFG
jgi:sporadic carbohydrate cluster protein (TIGR04323 family)